jgi:CBS domain-containing protein
MTAAELTFLAARWRSVTVADAMHRGVVTCPHNACAVVAARIMAAHRIHFVVVVDASGHCVASVSDVEVLAAAKNETLELVTAREIGTPPVLVEPTVQLAAAVRLMHRHAVTHLVVAERRSSRPLGVISVLDVVDRM